MSELSSIEGYRKQAIEKIRGIFAAVEAVPRLKDKRKYRSQCMYVYHRYELSHNFSTDRCHPMDLFAYQAAIYDLTKLERKLRMFWFYEGRHISFDQAVNEHMPDALEAPKYRTKRSLAIPSDFKEFLRITD